MQLPQVNVLGEIKKRWKGVSGFSAGMGTEDFLLSISARIRARIRSLRLCKTSGEVGAGGLSAVNISFVQKTPSISVPVVAQSAGVEKRTFRAAKGMLLLGGGVGHALLFHK